MVLCHYGDITARVYIVRITIYNTMNSELNRVICFFDGRNAYSRQIGLINQDTFEAIRDILHKAYNKNNDFVFTLKGKHNVRERIN